MDTNLETTPTPKDENTVTFKRSQFYAVLVVMAFAVGVLVGYLAWGRSAAAQPVAGAPENGPAAQAPAAQNPTGEAAPNIIRYDVPDEGFPSIGPQDAPIVIVEFSDFQCPYCTKWHNEVYQPLMEAFPGQIRLVYRNFPLTSIHGDAFQAAEAALCAGDQDAYWPYHDKLFNGQYGLGETAYQQYAADLDLDMTTFNDCLSNGTYQEAVQADMDFAIDLGVRSTPTFFINGLAVVGAQPLSVFQKVVSQELAGELPQ